MAAAYQTQMATTRLSQEQQEVMALRQRLAQMEQQGHGGETLRGSYSSGQLTADLGGIVDQFFSEQQLAHHAQMNPPSAMIVGQRGVTVSPPPSVIGAEQQQQLFAVARDLAMQFMREEMGRVRSREMELAEQVVQRAHSYEHGLEVQASERVALLSQEAGAHLQHQTLVQNEAVASLAATRASAAGEALVARQALMTSEELAIQLQAANARIQEEAMIAYRQAESATEQRLKSEFQQALANTRAGEQKAADQAERAAQQASLSNLFRIAILKFCGKQKRR
jgi:hypothetical protein